MFDKPSTLNRWLIATSLLFIAACGGGEGGGDGGTVADLDGDGLSDTFETT